jgi:hypothetical protein
VADTFHLIKQGTFGSDSSKAHAPANTRGRVGLNLNAYPERRPTIAPDAKHYDKLGSASLAINEGEQWKPGERELSADSGKFRIKLNLL